jgi:hypothetical protein
MGCLHIGWDRQPINNGRRWIPGLVARWSVDNLYQGELAEWLPVADATGWVGETSIDVLKIEALGYKIQHLTHPVPQINLGATPLKRGFCSALRVRRPDRTSAETQSMSFRRKPESSLEANASKFLDRIPTFVSMARIK